MDAESGPIQADPGQPYGIVGSGWEDEASSEGSCFGGFGERFWVKGVVGFLDGDDDMKVADRSFGGDFPDAAREVAQDPTAVIEGPQVSSGETDAHPGSAAGRRPAGRRNGDHLTGRYPIPIKAWIEFPDEVRMGSRLFGDHFEDGFVAQFLGLGFPEPGFGDTTESGEIRPIHGHAGEGIGSEHQGLLGVVIQSSGAFKTLLHLEGAKGGGGLGSGDTIDGTGIDAMGSEGDLGF
jgi:hypothetical protein